MRATLIIGICALLAACGSRTDGPEQLIREWVADAESAAEVKDRGVLVDMISENYSDGRGNDHDSVNNMLRYYFLRQQTVSLVTRIDEINISGVTAADVLLTVGMAGTTNHAKGIRADAYKFHLELENDDGDWFLTGARWAELGAELQ